MKHVSFFLCYASASRRFYVFCAGADVSCLLCRSRSFLFFFVCVFWAENRSFLSFAETEVSCLFCLFCLFCHMLLLCRSKCFLSFVILYCTKELAIKFRIRDCLFYNACSNRSSLISYICLVL